MQNNEYLENTIEIIYFYLVNLKHTLLNTLNFFKEIVPTKVNLKAFYSALQNTNCKTNALKTFIKRL